VRRGNGFFSAPIRHVHSKVGSPCDGSSKRALRSCSSVKCSGKVSMRPTRSESSRRSRISRRSPTARDFLQRLQRVVIGLSVASITQSQLGAEPDGRGIPALAGRRPIRGREHGRRGDTGSSPGDQSDDRGRRRERAHTDHDMADLPRKEQAPAWIGSKRRPTRSFRGRGAARAYRRPPPETRHHDGQHERHEILELRDMGQP
jgi:hypothetical protein